MTNRLLVVGAAVELAIAAVFLFAPPVATVLGHESPPLVGWMIALGSVPLLLAVDAVHKTMSAKRRASTGEGELEILRMPL
jgi:hypothetical protein